MNRLWEVFCSCINLGFVFVLDDGILEGMCIILLLSNRKESMIEGVFG